MRVGARPRAGLTLNTVDYSGLHRLPLPLTPLPHPAPARRPRLAGVSAIAYLSTATIVTLLLIAGLVFTEFRFYRAVDIKCVAPPPARTGACPTVPDSPVDVAALHTTASPTLPPPPPTRTAAPTAAATSSGSDTGDGGLKWWAYVLIVVGGLLILVILYVGYGLITYDEVKEVAVRRESIRRDSIRRASMNSMMSGAGRWVATSFGTLRIWLSRKPRSPSTLYAVTPGAISPKLSAASPLCDPLHPQMSS